MRQDTVSANRSVNRDRENLIHRRQKHLAAAVVTLGAAIFVVDLSLPLGVAGGVPYVALILLGWWFKNTRYIVLLGIVSAILTVAGYLLSPEGGIAWMVLTNRALALFAIGVTVILLGLARRADLEVQAANDELERRVSRRTAELQDAQTALLRKERLAALGQLTGTVAHELRNPLGVISTSIEVVRLRSAKSGLGIEAAIGRLRRAVIRCDTIITELLDFARAKGHQPGPVELDSWLSRLLDEQRIPEHVSLVRDLQTGAAIVQFDAESLRRAVINIVENACHAMTDANGGRDEATGHRLTIESRLAGGQVEIIVSDTGPGIPEDELPLIMEPLYSTKSFGTGLGLPTVQRILEEHGGGIRIDSEAGCGTRVSLYLPAARTADTKAG